MKIRNGKLWIGAVAFFMVSVFTIVTLNSYASTVESTSFPDHSQLEIITSLPGDSKSSPDWTASSLIIVDQGVDNYRALLQELADASDQVNPDVLVLDPERDGISQITRWFASRSGQYDSVHIISHAFAGELVLGSTTLQDDMLDAYLTDFEVWRGALSQDADILIYGCELTANTSGQNFAENLSRVTQADVAA